MPYVIYNKETKIRFQIRARSVGCYTDSWATEGACKATLTRESKKDPEFNRDDYAIAEIHDFMNNIDEMETKTFIHPLTGKESTITQSKNTPRCCDPTSELYWSM
jgi:hypothetical protein